jgi:hypothetical protein
MEVNLSQKKNAIGVACKDVKHPVSIFIHFHQLLLKSVKEREEGIQRDVDTFLLTPIYWSRYMN